MRRVREVWKPNPSARIRMGVVGFGRGRSRTGARFPDLVEAAGGSAKKPSRSAWIAVKLDKVVADVIHPGLYCTKVGSC